MAYANKYLYFNHRAFKLKALHKTVSIRIVADCGHHSCQVTRKLKRLPAEASAQAGATNLEFTTGLSHLFSYK